MSINNATPEMWDALRMEHPPIENNPLTNALKSYAAEAEKEEEERAATTTTPRRRHGRLS